MKKVLISDISVFTNPLAEALRVEALYSAIRLNYLGMHIKEIEYTIASNMPKHNEIANKWVPTYVTDADQESDGIPKYLAPIKRIAEEVSPDLFVFGVDGAIDWDVIEQFRLKGLKSLGDKAFVINLDYFNSKIVVPKMIKTLGL